MGREMSDYRDGPCPECNGAGGYTDIRRAAVGNLQRAVIVARLCHTRTL